jgi:choline dehydrogenase
MADGEPFDVVIVGGGPAGCVLANRLTEDAGRTVALVEAGPDYGPDPYRWPAELRDPGIIGPDLHSWGYTLAGRPADRPLALHRARVVGGTSAINGCLWLRGSAADYDGWAALGNPGWSFDDLLPYFRKAEADPMGGPLHGTDGPVPVDRAPDATLPGVALAFAAAARALGFPWIDDLNGDPEQRPGVGPGPKNVAGDVRMSAAFTYLGAARPRPNLTLVTNALVDRVVVEEGRAAGVRMADGSEVRGREVVLCAGAYGSPAILLRSGIGPAADLRALGIPVVADRSGVGANLHDHPMVQLVNADGMPVLAVTPDASPQRPAFARRIVKARSSQAVDEIDLHIYPFVFLDEARGRWVFLLNASLQRATSRGTVRLTSPDPEAPLEIDHNYLAEPGELDACCDGLQLAARLAATEPLASATEPVPGDAPDWADRDQVREWVRSTVGTTFHPSSTCRMGPADDPAAVVDHEGRVRGVEGLRVADASIFPTGPRANLHCTVVAVAEKLADAMRHAI